MTKPSKPHPRSSQWVVFERRLALLLRLMQGEATGDQLRQIVRDKAEDEIDAQALDKRFEEDRSRLRGWFGCEINYDRATDTYMLLSVERALFDLSPEALRGLAFLEATFSGNDAPMAIEIQALTDALTRVLPKARREVLRRERGLLELDLQPRDTDDITDEVWRAVRLGVSERRQLEFDYLSPQQDDGQIRRHCVEPYRYFYEPTRGHYYLEAYCREMFGPRGRWTPPDPIITYRLGRIRQPRILPTHFSSPRRARDYELVYQLAPTVARLGVSEHLRDSQIEMHEDGGATVRARSRNLFFDLRTLLHYGENCHVIGGDEAVKKMWELVAELYKSYEQQE